MTNKRGEKSTTGKRGYILTFCTVAGLLLLSGVLYAVLIAHNLSQQDANALAIGNRHVSTEKISPTSSLPALFSDDFVDNSQNWNVGSGSGYSSVISGGSLTMTETNHRIFREPLPLATTYSDFTITTTFTFIKGDANDSVGLYLRTTDNSGQGYYIDIFGNSKYDIAKIVVDAHNTAGAQYLAEPTSNSSILPQGQPNTLTVIMKGSAIVLLINSTLVKTVHDSAFMNGGITLFVDNGSSSDGVTASFDSVQVYSTPSQLPN